ncbi:amidase [Arboricoccus pini]|uniref:Amidase n=1 Tax=Arboricoccus pini TaxID=1963835 RepID=A0A212RQ08_9PROT|nr:amidase family protein [Arboricoccus pini]SNB74541.1 amidase [Arboricoccus pini]
MTVDPFDPATRLVRLLRERRIGALELLDQMIERVLRLDGPLNAVVVRDFERARERARGLDSTTGPVGPLHGLPMTVKESFDIVGLPTTLGFPERARYKIAESALAIERLEAAGAVIFGKTNVPTALADWQSANALYGTTCNPWNLELTAGGSSGGSAAALAAGLTPLELGSDIGGSIRQPAHACGVFGHKSTYGLVPRRAAPGRLPFAVDIAVSGPLARTAADLDLALDVLAGPDPALTRARLSLPPGPVTLSGLKVAIWAEDGASPTDGQITQAILDLVPRLEAKGAIVDVRARPAFDPAFAMALYLMLLTQPLTIGVEPEIAAAKAAEFKDLFARFPIDQSPVGLSHQAWLKLDAQRSDLTRRYAAFFADWDVLLCPAFSIPAHRHLTGEQKDWHLDVGGQLIDYGELLFWPGIIGAFGLPATVVPLGITRDNQPFGLQIVGPLHGDRITIAVAGLLEAMGLTFQRPTGYG